MKQAKIVRREESGRILGRCRHRFELPPRAEEIWHPKREKLPLTLHIRRKLDILKGAINR
jgi:hypothetical protein